MSGTSREISSVDLETQGLQLNVGGTLATAAASLILNVPSVGTSLTVKSDGTILTSGAVEAPLAINVGGTLIVQDAPTLTAQAGPAAITANGSIVPPTLGVRPALTVIGASVTQALVDVLGLGASPAVVFGRADVSGSSLTAPGANTLLGSVRAYSYTGAAWGVSLAASVDFFSNSAPSPSDTSSFARFQVTPVGGTAPAEAMRLNSTGHLLLGTTTDDNVNLLQVNGGVAINGTLTATAVALPTTNGVTVTAGQLGLAPIANNDVLANVSGTTAAPVPTTLSSLIDHAIGSVQGEVLFRGSTGWSVLAPGTAGQSLVTGGAGANPFWATSNAISYSWDDLVVQYTGASSAANQATTGNLSVAQVAGTISAVGVVCPYNGTAGTYVATVGLINAGTLNSVLGTGTITVASGAAANVVVPLQAPAAFAVGNNVATLLTFIGASGVTGTVGCLRYSGAGVVNPSLYFQNNSTILSQAATTVAIGMSFTATAAAGNFLKTKMNGL